MCGSDFVKSNFVGLWPRERNCRERYVGKPQNVSSITMVVSWKKTEIIADIQLSLQMTTYSFSAYS